MKILFTGYDIRANKLLFALVPAILVATCIAMWMAPILVAILGVAIGTVFTSFIINSRQTNANELLLKSLGYMLCAAIIAGIVTGLIAASLAYFLFMIPLTLLIGIGAGVFLATFFIISKFMNAAPGTFGFSWLKKNLLFAAIVLALGLAVIFAASMISLPLALAIGFAAACAVTASIFMDNITENPIKTVIVALILLVVAPAAIVGIIFALTTGLAIPILIALGIATAAICGALGALFVGWITSPSQSPESKATHNDTKKYGFSAMSTAKGQKNTNTNPISSSAKGTQTNVANNSISTGGNSTSSAPSSASHPPALATDTVDFVAISKRKGADAALISS